MPAGYNVFGYSDDPMVCHDAPEVSSDICTDFKGKVSGDVEYVSLLCLILKMVDLGEGLPLVAPTMGLPTIHLVLKQPMRPQFMHR